MVRYELRRGNNQIEHIGIVIHDNNFPVVYGSKNLANYYFKSINRKPPNKYGNFYKREKAGLCACLEILNKFKKDIYMIKEIYDGE